MRLLLVLLALTLAIPASGQRACRTRFRPFDGAGELRRRADELTTGGRAGFGLMRTTVACLDDSTALHRKAAFGPVAPDIRAGYSGGLPDSRADGALWAGRGISGLVRAGFTLDWRAVHLAVIPEVWYTANRPFDLLPGLDATRSSLSSPFYAGRYSLDLPSRMGRQPIAEVSPGQSTLFITTGPVDFGWSSSNLWWGAGVRDAIFIGPNAAGIPRAFVRTSSPVQTILGRLSGEYFFGFLAESRYFDYDSRNDRRSLSAIALTWSPSNTDAVVLGVARGVMKVSPDNSTIGRHLADAIIPLGISDGDQLTAFFARYVLPKSGLRAYAELARARTTSSLRDILTVPNEGLAYQVGVETLVRRQRANWMFLAEALNLEQGIDVQQRPPRDFYTGDGTLQGWTQRGQLLGAGIGPGGQSQWLSVDRMAPHWSAGLFAERVRWNNDALFRQYLPYTNRHDVSLRMGARVGFRRLGYDVALDASWGKRLNYLFQNNEFIPSYRTVDVSVPQLHLTLSPVAR